MENNKLKEKIKRIINKAERKFSVAQKLYEFEAYDDAISRSYYAMFHAVIALLLIKSIHPEHIGEL